MPAPRRQPLRAGQRRARRAAERDPRSGGRAEACRRALYEDPESPQLNFRAGRAAEAGTWLGHAAEYYRAAAEAGYAPAQNNLGALYHNGHGVSQDFAAAALWYGRSADQGDVWAMFNLGVLHEHGQGVPQSASRAYGWYERAAGGGHEGARAKAEGFAAAGVRRGFVAASLEEDWFEQCMIQERDSEYCFWEVYEGGWGLWGLE